MSDTYLAHRPGRGIVRETWANADGGETAEQRAERRARGVIASQDLAQIQREREAAPKAAPAKQEPEHAIVTRRGAGGPATIDRNNPPAETPDYGPTAQEQE